MNFEDLRQKYSLFIYDSFSYELIESEIHVTYHFSIPRLGEFKPELWLPLPSGAKEIKNWRLFERLLFCIGMVELISYWKVCCPAQVLIKAGSLNAAEREFWLDLYWGGLGEFFYRNDIQTDRQTFMYLQMCETRENLPYIWTEDDGVLQLDPQVEKSKPRCLIPVGGGKDSVVTLEFLRDLKKSSFVFAINPTKATKDTIAVSGIKNHAYVRRKLDPFLLELNRQGFLNGHTPFSALLAFVSLAVAYLYNLDYIVLSNEGSANESSVHGATVNHQFSKTTEFELAFQAYVSMQLGLKISYFSLLRPLSELAIARHFAAFNSYHDVFRSCNLGGKTDSWCGKCAKCLFVALMIAPFLGVSRTHALIGSDILDDVSLFPVLLELAGFSETKPFECVGTVGEVKMALALLQRRTERQAKLLQLYLDTLKKRGESHSFVPDNDELLVIDSALYQKIFGLYDRTTQLPSVFKPYFKLGYVDGLEEQLHLSLQFDAEEWKQVFRFVKNDLTSSYKTEVAASFSKVLILGFGREGKAILSSLWQILPSNWSGVIGVADAKQIPEQQKEKLLQRGFALKFHEGKDYLDALKDYPLCFISPGISMKDYTSEILSDGRLGAFPTCKIMNQADLFLQYFGQNTVGVTGTKGKSTTTSYLYAILQQKGRAHLLGNIGRAPLTAALDISDDDRIALELSCHQLQFTGHSPKIAVVTNLYPEHLDHYRSLSEYYASKLNILRFQRENDWAIINADQEDMLPYLLSEIRGNVILLTENIDKILSNSSAEMDWRLQLSSHPNPRCAQLRWAHLAKTEPTSLQLRVFEGGSEIEFLTLFDLPLSLSGKHHAYDLAYACLAAGLLGSSSGDCQKATKTFTGLPHRCEDLGIWQGVSYYNDSISTIPETCLNALDMLKKVDHLIIGGMDRGIDYQKLEDNLCEFPLQTLICLPDTGWQIADRLLQRLANQSAFGGKIIKVISVAQAVEQVALHAKLGDVCLFSPAAASYHQYRNFAERGEDFKKNIQKLLDKKIL